MTTLDNIHQYSQLLPDPLQQEVLDFVKFLLFKKEQSIISEPDEIDWSEFSLAAAMRGMENEESPIYTTNDLKERF